MEAVLQFTGGSGSAVPIKEKEPEPNPWLGVLDATLGARQESIFDEFVLGWDHAIRSSVSLGSINVSRGFSESGIGQKTNHLAALRALDSALADANSDDAKTWEVVKTELQKDRTSSRKLFK